MDARHPQQYRSDKVMASVLNKKRTACMKRVVAGNIISEPDVYLQFAWILLLLLLMPVYLVIA